MTAIDTSAQRAEYRRRVNARTSEVALILSAIADAWDRAEETSISESEAQRWSPVVSAALNYTGVPQ